MSFWEDEDQDDPTKPYIPTWARKATAPTDTTKAPAGAKPQASGTGYVPTWARAGAAAPSDAVGPSMLPDQGAMARRGGGLPFAEDTKTGAPYNVRAAIAPLRSTEEKIRVASQMLGAQVMETQQGLGYVDPKTNALVLLDEDSPFTRADVVEGLPAIGGAAGGMASMAAGGPATAAVVGATAGTAGQLAGQEAQRFFARRANPGGNVPGMTMGDVTQAAAENVLGEGLGFGLGRAVSKLRPGAAQTVTRAAQSAETGVPQTVGQVLNSRALTGIEAGFSGLPGGAGAGGRMGVAQVQAGEEALRGTTQRMAGGRRPPTISDLGNKARVIATQRADQVFNQVGTLYDEVADGIASIVPGGRITRLNHLAQARQDLVARLVNEPDPGAQAAIKTALEEADQVLKGIEAGGYAPRQLAQTRSRVSRAADYSNPLEAPTPQSEARRYLKDIRAAIDADFKEYAEVAGGDILRKHTQATDLVKSFRDASMKKGMENAGAGATFWTRVQTAESPKAAFDVMFQAVEDNPNFIYSLRRQLGDDEWGQFSSRYLRRMGEARRGAGRTTIDPTTGLSRVGEAAEETNFSISTFLTNWNGIKASERRALFGNNLPEVDKLVQVLERVKHGEKMLNQSKTAHGVMLGTVSAQAVKNLTGLGAATTAAGGAALAAGGPAAAAGSIAAVLATPYLLMKFSTSPRVMQGVVGLARILERPNTGRVTQQVSAQIGRLIAASRGNEDLAAAVDEYVQRLQAAGVVGANRGPF